jgi:hypothetical protein
MRLLAGHLLSLAKTAPHVWTRRISSAFIVQSLWQDILSSLVSLHSQVVSQCLLCQDQGTVEADMLHEEGVADGLDLLLSARSP